MTSSDFSDLGSPSTASQSLKAVWWLAFGSLLHSPLAFGLSSVVSGGPVGIFCVDCMAGWKPLLTALAGFAPQCLSTKSMDVLMLFPLGLRLPSAPPLPKLLAAQRLMTWALFIGMRVVGILSPSLVVDSEFNFLVCFYYRL